MSTVHTLSCGDCGYTNTTCEHITDAIDNMHVRALRAEAEVERLTFLLDALDVTSGEETMRAEAAVAEVRRLREALEYYAADDTIPKDGETARRALRVTGARDKSTTDP